MALNDIAFSSFAAASLRYALTYLVMVPFGIPYSSDKLWADRPVSSFRFTISSLSCLSCISLSTFLYLFYKNVQCITTLLYHGISGYKVDKKTDLYPAPSQLA